MGYFVTVIIKLRYLVFCLLILSSNLYAVEEGGPPQTPAERIARAIQLHSVHSFRSSAETENYIEAELSEAASELGERSLYWILNQPNIARETHLINSAVRADLSNTTWLLKNGANPDWVDENGETALLRTLKAFVEFAKAFQKKYEELGWEPGIALPPGYVGRDTWDLKKIRYVMILRALIPATSRLDAKGRNGKSLPEYLDRLTKYRPLLAREFSEMIQDRKMELRGL